VNVGVFPKWGSRTPDGRLHIVCTGNYADIEGSIYIFDPLAGEVVDSINIGGQPANLAISPLGMGYLAAGGWSDRGYVYAYDIETLEIINGPDNPILAGLGVTNVAVDSLGFVYTCDMGDDTVSKLSPSGNELGLYSVGDGPVFAAIIDDAVLEAEPGVDSSAPHDLEVLVNYPNPFNAGTMIRYDLPREGFRAEAIEILDILGRRIKSIYPGTADNLRMVYWDGRNDAGDECGSGVYFGRIIGTIDGGATIEVESRGKMTLVR